VTADREPKTIRAHEQEAKSERAWTNKSSRPPLGRAAQTVEAESTSDRKCEPATKNKAGGLAPEQKSPKKKNRRRANSPPKTKTGEWRKPQIQQHHVKMM
jgi:hypothetical protein